MGRHPLTPGPGQSLSMWLLRPQLDQVPFQSRRSSHILVITNCFSSHKGCKRCGSGTKLGSLLYPQPLVQSRHRVDTGYRLSYFLVECHPAAQDWESLLGRGRNAKKTHDAVSEVLILEPQTTWGHRNGGLHKVHVSPALEGEKRSPIRRRRRTF